MPRASRFPSARPLLTANDALSTLPRHCQYVITIYCVQTLTYARLNIHWMTRTLTVLCLEFALGSEYRKANIQAQRSPADGAFKQTQNQRVNKHC
jgi:hypothetical protein